MKKDSVTTVSDGTTHQVLNQAVPLSDFNLYASDMALVEGVHRYGASWAVERISEFGERMGSSQVQKWADEANRNLPTLKTHDRFGNRVDEVEFHPSWHELMKLSCEYGLHNLPWVSKRKGSQVARAAMMFMAYQTEAGHCCPISMTYACLPTLKHAPRLAARWEPLLHSKAYDGRLILSEDKGGVILGMGMTEKQGGSDVRANTTSAHPDGTEEGLYFLTGHKWFCSAPMSDAFLVLAQAPGGLSCFLVPRILENGERNIFRIQRLKDKLGNKSNASSEVEFNRTHGYLVGEEGRGVATIVQMVNGTRLDCAIGAAALMRQATLQAFHHCKFRSAFGKKLVDQPLMRNVLADLALESEAATCLMLRLASTYDGASRSGGEKSLQRILSAIAKYWLCKRAPVHVAEALECLGGNGYVEESIMPRLFRESPLNSIWEGSGNVICLDVLRALVKEEGTADALGEELRSAVGTDTTYDAFVDSLVGELVEVASLLGGEEAGRGCAELSSRRLVEKLALAVQAGLLIKYAPAPISSAFVVSRLAGDHGAAFGTLPVSVKLDSILERVFLE